MDLALQGFETTTKKEVGNLLSYILAHLARFSWVKNIHCINTALVPVLKIVRILSKYKFYRK